MLISTPKALNFTSRGFPRKMTFSRKKVHNAKMIPSATIAADASGVSWSSISKDQTSSITQQWYSYVYADGAREQACDHGEN